MLKYPTRNLNLAINLVCLISILLLLYQIFSTDSFNHSLAFTEQKKLEFKIFVYDLEEKYFDVPKKDMIEKVYKENPSHQQYYHEIYLAEFFRTRGRFVKETKYDHVFTNNPAEADLFFVPYISGAVALSSDMDIVNTLHRDLKQYLNTFHHGYYWKRNHGRDHVFLEGFPAIYTKEEFKESIFIGQDWLDVYDVIESQSERIIMVPYIGFGDFNIEKNIYSQAEKTVNEKRPFFAAFSGSWEVHEFNVDIRKGLKKTIEQHQIVNKDQLPIMTNEMKDRGKVQLDSTEKIYSQSDFCFVPAGDSAQSKRLFDVMFYLCIPVIISNDILLPFMDQIPWQELVLFLPEKKFRQIGKTNTTTNDSEMNQLLKPLMEMSLEEKIKKRKLILKYRQLLTFKPFYPDNEGDNGMTLLMNELQHQANRFRRWKGFKERLEDLNNKN